MLTWVHRGARMAYSRSRHYLREPLDECMMRRAVRSVAAGGLTQGIRPLCPVSRQDREGIMLPMVGHTMGTSSVILYALHTMPAAIVQREVAQHSTIAGLSLPPPLALCPLSRDAFLSV